MFGIGSQGILTWLYQALLSLPGIIFALSVHEWAHAFAAYKLGDPTARNLGRLTLDPFKHLDPFGFIMLLLVRFGWAKPVPINPRNFKHPRRDDIIVSLAGICANFVTAFLGVGVYLLVSRLLPWDGLNPFSFNAIINMILFYFFTISTYLIALNILPIPPLDGSHVFESLFVRILPPGFFQLYRRYGFILLIIVLMAPGVRGYVLEPIADGVIFLFDKFYGLFF